MHMVVRPLLVAIGTLAVAVGIVGIFVPVLPTTPFLLLAAACYARSSDRFLRWLLYNPWFGSYVRNYRERQGMPKRLKLLTLLALWLTLGLSAAIAVPAWWGRIALIVVGLGVTIHLLRINTYRPAPDPKLPGHSRAARPPSRES